MLEEVPIAPWLSVPPVDDRSRSQVQAEHAHSDLIPSVRELLTPRYAGAWFSHSDGMTTCNFAAVKADREDQEAVEALRDAIAPSTRLPVRVVDVPRSEAQLETLVGAFEEVRIGATTGVELARVELRVDLGKLVLSVATEGDPAAARSMARTMDEELRAAAFPDDGYVITGVAHRGRGRVS